MSMGYPAARGGAKGMPPMMYPPIPGYPPSYPPPHHHHHHHHAPPMHRPPMPAPAGAAAPPAAAPQYPAPMHHHHHHHHHHHQAPPQHQHQHQRQPPRGVPAQAQQQVGMNRSGLAKAPTKDELNKRYEMVINQPPPPPAYATKPPPMTLREGRNCSITVRVKLPNGSDVRIPLDLNDVLNDVRAAVEAQSKYSGVELLVFHSDHEVRNTTMTVKEMGITNGEVIEVKLDTARSGWGIAAVPDPAEAAKAELESRPGHKEDTEEWKKLHPGESKVVQGYEDKPMSDKGKMLMDIYEEVMSRPPPGTSNDPRSETPCQFYSAGKTCRFGEKCMYSHAGKSGNGGVFFQRPDPRSKVDCVFFKSGRCLKHQNCPFKHERPQPKRELTNPDLPPP